MPRSIMSGRKRQSNENAPNHSVSKKICGKYKTKLKDRWVQANNEHDGSRSLRNDDVDEDGKVPIILGRSRSDVDVEQNPQELSFKVQDDPAAEDEEKESSEHPTNTNGLLEGRSQEETEAAHDLLSLSQSLPPLPAPGVVIIQHIVPSTSLRPTTPSAFQQTDQIQFSNISNSNDVKISSSTVDFHRSSLNADGNFPHIQFYPHERLERKAADYETSNTYETTDKHVTKSLPLEVGAKSSVLENTKEIVLNSAYNVIHRPLIIARHGFRKIRPVSIIYHAPSPRPKTPAITSDEKLRIEFDTYANQVKLMDQNTTTNADTTNPSDADKRQNDFDVPSYVKVANASSYDRYPTRDYRHEEMQDEQYERINNDVYYAQEHEIRPVQVIYQNDEAEENTPPYEDTTQRRQVIVSNDNSHNNQNNHSFFQSKIHSILPLTPPTSECSSDAENNPNPQNVTYSDENADANNPNTRASKIVYTYDALLVSDGRSKNKTTTPSASVFLNENKIPRKVEPKAGKYICSECGKQYATSSNLSRHKQTHRSLDSQNAKKCKVCGKAYVSMPALSMHILTHKLLHSCDMCGKQFSRPWLLQGHLRSHTGEKPYGCAHCGKSFADRSNLRAHMQTHSNDKTHECTKCHKSFALKSYLNKHLESSCMKGDNEEEPGEVGIAVGILSEFY